MFYVELAMLAWFREPENSLFVQPYYNDVFVLQGDLCLDDGVDLCVDAVRPSDELLGEASCRPYLVVPGRDDTVLIEDDRSYPLPMGAFPRLVYGDLG